MKNTAQILLASMVVHFGPPRGAGNPPSSFGAGMLHVILFVTVRTVGILEAFDVRSCLCFFRGFVWKSRVLFGSSMPAVPSKPTESMAFMIQCFMIQNERGARLSKRVGHLLGLSVEVGVCGRLRSPAVAWVIGDGMLAVRLRCCRAARSARPEKGALVSAGCPLAALSAWKSTDYRAIRVGDLRSRAEGCGQNTAGRLASAQAVARPNVQMFGGDSAGCGTLALGSLESPRVGNQTILVELNCVS